MIRTAVRTAGRVAIRSAAYSSATGPSLRDQVVDALYGSGEQGYLLDPSSAVYQDSRASVVSTSETVVGFLPDSRFKLERGPEELTNGDFSDGSIGWTTAAGWSINAGVATFVGGTPGYLSSTASPTVGEYYEITFTLQSIAGGSVSVYIGGSPSVQAFSAAGTYTVTGIAQSGSLNFAIRGNSSDPEDTAVVSSVSARAFPGNHFLQPTTAAKPMYETNGTLHWVVGDGFDDFLETASIDWGNGTQITLFFAAFREPTMSNAPVLSSSPNLSTTTGVQILANGGSVDNWNVLYLSGGDVESYRSTQTTAPTLDVFVMTLDITNSGTVADQLRIWTNGVENGSVPAVAANAGTLDSTVSRLLRSATAHSSVTVFAAGAIVGLISDENRVLVEQWLAEKSGVTL